jgi:hypothetical protein
LPLIGEGGDNLKSILFISPMADLWDPVSLPHGAGMQISEFLRVQGL